VRSVGRCAGKNNKTIICKGKKTKSLDGRYHGQQSRHNRSHLLMSMQMRRADFMTRPPALGVGWMRSPASLEHRDAGDPGTAGAGLNGNGTVEPKVAQGMVTAVPEGEGRARSRRR